MTDLSVIVVCYRGWERLTLCLDSLSAFRNERHRKEVIVVDNNSGDGVIGEFEKKYPGFRFIKNSVNGGYANGNNLGSRFASGEFLLILNPDTIVSENAVDDLLSAARSNPEYSVISCRQVSRNGKESAAYGTFPGLWSLTGFQRTVRNFIRKGFNKMAEPSGNVFFPDWISGSLVLIRKALYEKLGGFYEGFWMYYEDVDLCFRVRRGGGKVAFFRGITIEHNHGGSSRINLRTTVLTKTEVLISRHVYVARNFSGIRKYAAQIFLILNNLITGAIMAFPGILLFFIPRIFIRTGIFLQLLCYYSGVILRKSWKSPRSVI